MNTNDLHKKMNRPEKPLNDVWELLLIGTSRGAWLADYIEKPKKPSGWRY